MSVRSTCMSYINARIISLQILQKIHADSWSQEFARIKTRLGWWQCIHDIFHNHPWMRSLQPSIDHVCFRNPFPWTSQFPDPEEAFPVLSDIRWKWNQLCWVKRLRHRLLLHYLLLFFNHDNGAIETFITTQAMPRFFAFLFGICSCFGFSAAIFVKIHGYVIWARIVCTNLVPFVHHPYMLFVFLRNIYPRSWPILHQISIITNAFRMHVT